MKRLSFALASLLVSSCFVGSTHATLATVVASDNADNAAYAPQPMHNWGTVNGGSGYGLWTPNSGTGGGGTFMDGVGVNGRQVDGNFSFALFSGSGNFGISRPLTSALASGEFEVLTRFDIPGTGPNIVSIRSGNNTTAPTGGELLSFGITNDSQLSYTDGTGFHTLASGESRGSVFSWKVDFNATAGTYSASVVNPALGGFSTTFSGALEGSGTTVGSFFAENSSTGNNNNVIFDNPTFSVPEPASMGLLAIGALAGLRRRRI